MNNFRKVRDAAPAAGKTQCRLNKADFRLYTFCISLMLNIFAPALS